MTAAKAGAAVTTHGVDLVDEDDAGRVLLALFEQVAHAACADAHEHFHEVRAGDAEEGHAGFARDGPRQQGLTRAGRAHHEHALRDATAKALELLRVLEEGDDLFDLVLRLVDTGHVRERDLVLRLAQQASSTLAEAHGLAATCLELAHEQIEHDDDEQHRQQDGEHRADERTALVLLVGDLYP